MSFGDALSWACGHHGGRPPESSIRGWSTANIALVVSALAAVVAIVAVIYTVRTYRRAGARVRVRLGRRKYLFNDVSGEPMLLPIVTVDISNTGLAAVQVSEISFETKDKAKFSLSPDISPDDLPQTLASMSAEIYGYRIDRLEAAVEDFSDETKIRAVILLAGTQIERSNWVGLSG